MRKKQIFLGTLCTAAVISGLLWGNSALETTCFEVCDPALPTGFEGFRIAQISDLHNALFGRDNETLLDRLAEVKPDVIVITGDLVDSRNTDIGIGVAFAEAAARIAPCYYVTGNHEARLEERGSLPELLSGLEQAGVTVLRNEEVILVRAGDRLRLLGVDDPTFQVDYMTGDCGGVLRQELKALGCPQPGYTVLLSHRPEWFSLYREFGVNLVFSGHAHGGQFRLPVVGGLIAPNQGFFPKYDVGVFTEKATTMVVSRGLGPSIIPLRIGNRPELVVTTLTRQEK